jgi:hypothetical protein
MKAHANFVRALLPLIVVAAVPLGLTACKPQETELSFETIEQDDGYSASRQKWEGRESKLLVMASAQDIEEARPFVTDEAITALRQMDFTTRFAIFAFRGWQGSSHSGFKIERIIRRGNEIVLYAQPGTRGPNPVESSPYHLIELKKEGNWGGDFTFSLYFDQAGVAAASTTHHMP